MLKVYRFAFAMKSDQLEHPSSGDLESYYRRRLAPEQVPLIESHVLKCGWCLDRLLAFTRRADSSGGEADGASDWFPAGARLTIRVLDSSCPPLAGQLLEYSKKDMKINVSEFLHPGTWVQVHFETTIAMAKVRHCVRQGQEYHVNLEVENVFAIPAKGSAQNDSNKPGR